MDFISSRDDGLTTPVTTASEARARLRERAGELKPSTSQPTAEHLSTRPQRLRWSGRHQA